VSVSNQNLPLVVSDATPLHYLILIGESHLLHQLYGTILIPAAVVQELLAPQTPMEVRRWIEAMPEWVEVGRISDTDSLPFPSLGNGEREAIALAHESSNSILLTDDFQARLAAESLGIQVVPTIRILAIAGAVSLVDFGNAIERLQHTNFRVSRKLIERILTQQSVQSSE
jgi:predicted nucleic acid-binding protein